MYDKYVDIEISANDAFLNNLHLKLSKIDVSVSKFTKGPKQNNQK